MMRTFLLLLGLGSLVQAFAQKSNRTMASQMVGVLSPLIYTQRYGPEQPVMFVQVASHTAISYLTTDNDVESEWRIGIGNSRFQFRGEHEDSLIRQYQNIPGGGAPKGYHIGNFEYAYLDLHYGRGKLLHFNKYKTDLWKLSGSLGLRLFTYNHRDGGSRYTDSTNGNQLVWIIKPEMKFRTISPVAGIQFSRLWRFENKLELSVGAEMNLGLMNLAKGEITIYPGRTFESGAKAFYNGGYFGFRFGVGFGPLVDPEKETDGEIHLVAGRAMHLIPWIHTWFFNLEAGVGFPGQLITNAPIEHHLLTLPALGINCGVRYRLTNWLAVSPTVGRYAQSIGFSYKYDGIDENEQKLFQISSTQITTNLESPVITHKWLRVIVHAGIGARFSRTKSITHTFEIDTLPAGIKLQWSPSGAPRLCYTTGLTFQLPRRLGNLQTGINFVYAAKPTATGLLNFFDGTSQSQTSTFNLSGSTIMLRIGYIFNFKGYSPPEK